MAFGFAIRGNTMNHSSRATLIALAIASAPALAGNYATRFSASDDPARWYQPLETPRQKYDNAMLEARNALAEALSQCRRSGSDRAACEAAARRQHAEEVSQAKTLLEPGRQVG
jgi:Skp family chaperone for outer membrane proteins